MPAQTRTEEDIPPRLKRWILFWNSISYAALLAVALLSVLDVRFDWPPPVYPNGLNLGQRLLCLAGAVLWGAWYWIFIVDYRRWRGRMGWKALSFLFAIGLSFGFSFLHPAFVFLLFGLFGVTFGVLPTRWAVVLVALIPFVFAGRVFLTAGITRDSIESVIWLPFYALMSILMGTWIAAIIRQGEERGRMLRQLQETQNELAQKERQAGMLAERQRLASVLHDTLAQDFTSVVMHLEAAEQALERDQAAAGEHIDQARRAAREGLAEARRYVWALQPEVTEREPLSAALERVVQRWQAENNIAAHFTIEGSPLPLPPPVEVALMRAVQEGLANVRKHAGASQVNLTLTFMEDEVLLDVQDNGGGFDPALAFHPSAEGGYGLFALRERLRELGGSLEVESEPGQGATLAVQVPLRAGDAAGEGQA